MREFDSGLLGFLFRNCAWAAVPAMWFAYIGGVSPWWGALAAVAAVLLLALPVRLLAWRREQLRRAARSEP